MEEEDCCFYRVAWILLVFLVMLLLKREARDADIFDYI